jgi:hypothetical protein
MRSAGPGQSNAAVRCGPARCMHVYVYMYIHIYLICIQIYTYMSDYAAVREPPQALTWGCRGIVMDAVGRCGRSQPGFRSVAGPSRGFVPSQGPAGLSFRRWCTSMTRSAPSCGSSRACRRRTSCERCDHICTGTGLAPPTSAPRLGSPLPTSAPGLGLIRPHPSRDWAHPSPHLHQDWTQPVPRLRRDGTRAHARSSARATARRFRPGRICVNASAARGWRVYY